MVPRHFPPIQSSYRIYNSLYHTVSCNSAAQIVCRQLIDYISLAAQPGWKAHDVKDQLSDFFPTFTIVLLFYRWGKWGGKIKWLGEGCTEDPPKLNMAIMGNIHLQFVGAGAAEAREASHVVFKRAPKNWVIFNAAFRNWHKNNPQWTNVVAGLMTLCFCTTKQWFPVKARDPGPVQHSLPHQTTYKGWQWQHWL